jgi:hypothetical protein
MLEEMKRSSKIETATDNEGIILWLNAIMILATLRIASEQMAECSN